MLRVRIRSRSGNIALAVIGGIHVVSALVMVSWVIRDVIETSVARQALAQLVVLAVAALCGVWFIAVALDNLGVRFVSQRPRTS